MPLRSALALLLALAVWGCASARDAYVDGMEHETAGDYPAAADAYITSLERDRSLPNVAGRLTVAGREAVRVYLARVPAQPPVEAARTWQAADALVRRAGAVGVDVERPGSFDADRDAAYAAAVAALTEAAEDHLGRLDYAATVAALDQARTFGTTDAEGAALDALALDAYDGWARADLAAGRYRSALGRADAALALGGRADRFDALRADILDAGTVVAAVFPVEADDDVPHAFARDLFDVVAEDRPLSASPFVVLVDPAEVRRWDRRRGRRLRVALADSPRRLADAARDLRADLGVVVYLSGIEDQTRVGLAETRTATLRAGGSTAYTVREVDLTVSLRADVIAVDAGGRSACDRSIERRASEAYDRASYDGDLGALELSRRERRAFADDVDERAVDRALTELRETLADAVAREIATCLDRQVP